MRGRIEKPKVEFGLDTVCPSCKGKRTRKDGTDCWTCQGRGVVRKEVKKNDAT